MTELSQDMTFREPLPEGCPPVEAEEITDVRVVFRLVRKNPPKDRDFSSKRAESPYNQFSVPECQARGLSVYSHAREARQQLKRPTLRGMLICQVTLAQGAGHILRTGRRSHYTWWPLASFDVLSNCQMVDQ